MPTQNTNQTPDMIAATLQRFVFRELDPISLANLSRTATSWSYRSGEPLWFRGDEGLFAYVVSGAFDIIRDGVIVDTAGSGCTLGHSALHGRPHGAQTRARQTDREISATVLLWNLRDSETQRIFGSRAVLLALMGQLTELVHHLNDVQILYRLKLPAVVHVAAHLLRLARCRPVQPLDDARVEIGQQELGSLTGYDERTVRRAEKHLSDRGCIESVQRLSCRVKISRLRRFIDEMKRETLARSIQRRRAVPPSSDTIHRKGIPRRAAETIPQPHRQQPNLPCRHSTSH